MRCLFSWNVESLVAHADYLAVWAAMLQSHKQQMARGNAKAKRKYLQRPAS